MSRQESRNGLLMLGGAKPAGLAAYALHDLMKQKPYCIAADHGADHLYEFGYLPDLLVGDGDSIREDTLAALSEAKVPFAVLPRAKDWTDGEAAYRAAFENGCERIAVFGALGGRLDHLLGNLLLPLVYQGQFQELTFYGEDCQAWPCFGETVVEGQPGDTVSLVALSPQVRNIDLVGFVYPLSSHDTKIGSSLCLSNELAEERGYVSFRPGGVMLVIHYPTI